MLFALQKRLVTVTGKKTIQLPFLGGQTVQLQLQHGLNLTMASKALLMRHRQLRQGDQRQQQTGCFQGQAEPGKQHLLARDGVCRGKNHRSRAALNRAQVRPTPMGTGLI